MRWPAGKDKAFTAHCQGDGRRVRGSEGRRIIKAASTLPCETESKRHGQAKWTVMEREINAAGECESVQARINPCLLSERVKRIDPWARREEIKRTPEAESSRRFIQPNRMQRIQNS